MRTLALFLMLIATPIQAEEIWLGITTTLRDSGVIDPLIAAYEAESGDKVTVLAQPTGQILKSAHDHNLDLVISHDEKMEQKFHDSGDGDRHIPFMESQFILVGPSADPVEVKDLDMDKAFQQIARAIPAFVTRADKSGTSERENEIWARNNITDLAFRTESGQGMGATLNIASAMNAYVFSELATFLKFQNKGDLVPLVDKGENLTNVYAISTLNKETFADRNLAGADRLVDFLLSNDAKALINDYKVENTNPFHSIDQN